MHCLEFLPLQHLCVFWESETRKRARIGAQGRSEAGAAGALCQLPNCASELICVSTNSLTLSLWLFSFCSSSFLLYFVSYVHLISLGRFTFELAATLRRLALSLSLSLFDSPLA